MATGTPPTDQRRDTRPIGFVLQGPGGPGTPIVLPIRPEDLTITEPSRVAVHQTLGRGAGNGITGWVDNFGAALPTATLAGTTGWRIQAGSGLDGVEAFQELNDLVMTAYHEAKQAAINSGQDPAGVRLLYVDTLNDRCWSVVPTNFVMRRSKSRPLLIQYNISLQALSTRADDPVQLLPPVPSTTLGLTALDEAAADLDEIPHEAALDGILGAIGDVIDFVQGVGGLISEAANYAANMAFNMAQAALNAHRVMLATASAPGEAAKNALLLAATLNEIVCLFRNALRPKPVYEQYSGLLGASNCSSTTGGSSPSAFKDENVFSKMFEGTQKTLILTGAAIGAIDTLKKMDGVLSPLPVPEVRGLLSAVDRGILR